MKCSSLEIYIKSIILEREKYSYVKECILQNYVKCDNRTIDFSLFQSWSLFAIILGIFKGYGDTTGTKLFCECMQYNYLPKIDISEHKNHVRICICIMQKKLDERKAEYQNSLK